MWEKTLSTYIAFVRICRGRLQNTAAENKKASYAGRQVEPHRIHPRDYGDMYSPRVMANTF